MGDVPVGPAAPPTGGPATTRERILREASVLFARKGYAATTTRQIAEAVGIRQPSLFHHFPTKAHIMQELLAYGLVPPARFAERVAADARPATERMYDYLMFDVQHIMASPYDFGGLFMDAVMDLPEFQDWTAVLHRLRGARQRIVADGISSGEFADVGVEFATHTLTGIMLGVTRSFSGLSTEEAADRGRRIATFALRALLADPTAVPARGPDGQDGRDSQDGQDGHAAGRAADRPGSPGTSAGGPDTAGEHSRPGKSGEPSRPGGPRGSAQGR
jgi:AcrR family transcriptional regulator